MSARLVLADERGCRGTCDRAPAVDSLAALNKNLRAHRGTYTPISEIMFTSMLLGSADAIVHMAEERPKPDAERHPSFRSATTSEQGMRHAQKTYARRLEIAKLTLALRRAAELPKEEQPAMLEILIEDTGLLEQLAAGAVLTGGAVLMEGMSEFAEEILGMPVRLGVPIGVRGITQLVAGPQYATGVGPVQYGAAVLKQANRAYDSGYLEEPVVTPPPAAKQPKKKSGSKLLSWLRAAF